jgi:hypothetical protein
MTTIENELVKLTIANKGGYIVEATLKNSENQGFNKLVQLIKKMQIIKRTISLIIVEPLKICILISLNKNWFRPNEL